MTRLPFVKSEFSIIPEGTYDFKIIKVEHDEVFGSLTVKLESDAGTVNQKWQYINKDNNTNDKVLNHMSYFAKNALNDFTSEDYDPNDLLGKWVTADVTHTVVPSTKEAGKNMTFVNIGEFKVCNKVDDGFVNVPTDNEVGEMFS